MEIQNSEIADIFNRMADLLDIQGANPFRIRAYRNAARTILNTQTSMADMVEKHEKLTELPGIGEDLGHKIEEVVETGALSALTQLAKSVPSSLAELMKLPSLGPKKAKTLHAKLHIKSLAGLRRAAEQGKVRELAGFGEKTEKRILEELKRLESRGPARVKLNVAHEAAIMLEKYLRKAPGIQKIAMAGSYRRNLETVGDLDIIVTCKNNQAVMDHFVKFGAVVKILAEGNTKASVLLRSGLQVDLRAVGDDEYGAALLYFTGSKAHNIALRTMALKQGLKINEYGVFRKSKRVASKTEEDVYRSIGLPYMEPELRENRGEFTASAKGRLPVLVSLHDIKGDLHAHTVATDGSATLEEMARAAQDLGYEYLAITDHTQNVRVAGGMRDDGFYRQWRAIEKLNAKMKGFLILKSAEVDILENGSLDLPDEALQEMDITVCSIHSHFNLSREKQTERILRAMDNPHFRIFGHPTGRLIGAREPYAFDFERVVRGAKERGRILEINSQPDRLDLSDLYARAAKEAGVLVAVSSDAHSVSQLHNMHYGIGMARRGWIEKNDVINTRSLRQLRKLIS